MVIDGSQEPTAEVESAQLGGDCIVGAGGGDRWGRGLRLRFGFAWAGVTITAAMMARASRANRRCAPRRPRCARTCRALPMQSSPTVKVPLFLPIDHLQPDEVMIYPILRTTLHDQILQSHDHGRLITHFCDAKPCFAVFLDSWYCNRILAVPPPRLMTRSFRTFPKPGLSRGLQRTRRAFPDVQTDLLRRQTMQRAPSSGSIQRSLWVHQAVHRG